MAFATISTASFRLAGSLYQRVERTEVSQEVDKGGAVFRDETGPRGPE